MEALSRNMRDMMATEISHRTMPNLINRAKATAAIVTAVHREEIMEAKRQSGLLTIMSAERPITKRLKKKSA